MRVALLSLLYCFPLLTHADIEFSTGFFSSRGDYDLEEETRLRATPLSLKLKNTQHALTLSSALVEIEGPSNIIDGVQQETDDTEQGFTDVKLKYRYSQTVSGKSPHWLDYDFSVKLPTASTGKGLSTGETDYQFGLGWTTYWQKTYWFADISYRISGDNDDLPLNNNLKGSIGFALPVGSAWQPGFLVEATQARDKRLENGVEGLFFLRWRLNKTHKFILFAAIANGSSLPDKTLGVQYTIRLR